MGKHNYWLKSQGLGEGEQISNGIYLLCNKCVGTNICGIGAELRKKKVSMYHCRSFISQASGDKWINPTPDMQDQMKELKAKKRIILGGDF